MSRIPAARDKLHIAVLSATESWRNYNEALLTRETSTNDGQRRFWDGIARASLNQFFMHIECHPALFPYRASQAGAKYDKRGER